MADWDLKSRKRGKCPKQKLKIVSIPLQQYGNIRYHQHIFHKIQFIRGRKSISHELKTNARATNEAVYAYSECNFNTQHFIAAESRLIKKWKIIWIALLVSIATSRAITLMHLILTDECIFNIAIK